MHFSDTKIFGYLLLFLGIGQIVFSGFNIYQVFTNQAKPITTFNLSAVTLDLSTIVPVPSSRGEKTTTEIIPASSLNDISNLTAHYLLMSFAASLGFKVSSIGVQLLRPIVVKLKASPEPVSHA